VMLLLHVQAEHAFECTEDDGITSSPFCAPCLEIARKRRKRARDKNLSVPPKEIAAWISRHGRCGTNPTRDHHHWVVSTTTTTLIMKLGSTKLFAQCICAPTRRGQVLGGGLANGHGERHGGKTSPSW